MCSYVPNVVYIVAKQPAYVTNVPNRVPNKVGGCGKKNNVSLCETLRHNLASLRLCERKNCVLASLREIEQRLCKKKTKYQTNPTTYQTDLANTSAKCYF